jgi:hypothetical protein
VRRSDTASWQYGRPNGETFRFQVMRHGVEPVIPNCSRNLLSKNDCRAALADETEPTRPKVPLVGATLPLAGG